MRTDKRYARLCAELVATRVAAFTHSARVRFARHLAIMRNALCGRRQFPPRCCWLTPMRHRTRVKFCGITRIEDALVAAKLGVDALGFVFYEPSPRAVSIARAAEIIAALPPFMTTVALFVDADASLLQRVMDELTIDIVQFHGRESAADCEAIGKPYIKAIQMSADIDLVQEAQRYRGARGLLLDAFDEKLPGGSGQSFQWSRVPPQLDKPVILAGGLSANNVARAIEMTNPFAVDVSSGIESEKGIKCTNKMQAFMHEVGSIER